MPNPIRAFCDYDIHKFGKDIVYYGTTKGSVKALEIKDREAAIKECNNLGLGYFEFGEKEDEYEAVREVLNDIGVDFGADRMTPLFYDYTCWIYCTEKFRSLGGEKTPECKYATKNIDSDNILN